MSVLFCEIDDLDHGPAFLRMAREKLDEVPAKRRAEELYTSFKTSLDQLARFVDP